MDGGSLESDITKEPEAHFTVADVGIWDLTPRAVIVLSVPYIHQMVIGQESVDMLASSKVCAQVKTSDSVPGMFKAKPKLMVVLWF